MSPHLLIILGGNVLNYINTVFSHDANAPTLTYITYILWRETKLLYTDRIHHTATESGLVVSISCRPHFKQIAPSRSAYSFSNDKEYRPRRRPVAGIYGSYSMSFNSSNVGEFFTSATKHWKNTQRNNKLNSMMHVQGYLFLFLLQPSLLSSRYLNFLVLVSMSPWWNAFISEKCVVTASFLSRFQ